MKIKFLIILSLFLHSYAIQADDDYDIEYSDSQHMEDVLDFDIIGNEKNKDFLMINIPSFRGVSDVFLENASTIARSGMNILSINLHTSYMIPETRAAYKNISPRDISRIINYAHELGYQNIFLSSSGSSSNLALKVSYDYQVRLNGNHLKGHIMHFPKVWSTDQSTGKTEIYNISKTSNLPVYMITSEYGTKFHLAAELQEILGLGGSMVYSHKLSKIREGFHLRERKHLRDQDIRLINKIGSIYMKAMSLLLISETREITIVDDPYKIPSSTPSTKLVKTNKKARTILSLTTFKDGLLFDKIDPNKKILLNFWASWCIPCEKEIPSMMDLKKAHGDEIQIISINVGESINDIRDFKKRVNFDFPVLMDFDGKMMREWKVFVFPTNFIIDGDNVTHSYTGSVDWSDKEIQESIFKKNQQKVSR